jgi:hypothetical protein
MIHLLAFFAGSLIGPLGMAFVAWASIASKRSAPDDPYLLNKDARRSAVEARPVPLAEYIERYRRDV